MFSKIKRYIPIIHNGWRRQRFENALAKIDGSNVPLVEGSVLVDASFDNPNYWIRVVVLLKALCVSNQQLVGLLGLARRSEQQRTLKKLGVAVIDDLAKDIGNPKYEYDAKDYLKRISRRENLLTEPLPYDVPPELFYDFLLKRQEFSYVRLEDPSLRKYIELYFALIDRAAAIIQDTKPQLVIASHAIGVTGPLVWLSLVNGIPVIVPYGQSGVSWYWKLEVSSDIFDFQDRLTHREFDDVSSFRGNAFEELGKIAVMNRLKGVAVDLGVREAYVKRKDYVDRDLIFKTFDWHESKPIVGVYASNWFDYPHTYGMKNFVDFFDWISCIYDIASNTDHCYWLFKAHPCDSWYGGSTLEDYFDFTDRQNIGLADTGWDSNALLHSLDGLITYHGTVGIEATCIRKPVLVSDDGWYTHIGFVKKPNDRNHFRLLLAEEWWQDMDLEENARVAHEFAGTYWCRPGWQQNYVLDDDTDMWSIYKTAIQMLKNSMGEITKEQELIRNWYLSNHAHYHAYKIMMAESFIVS